jgi:hypothetical protein
VPAFPRKVSLRENQSDKVQVSISINIFKKLFSIKKRVYRKLLKFPSAYKGIGGWKFSEIFFINGT